MSPLIDIPDTYLHWCSNVQVICLAPLCIRTSSKPPSNAFLRVQIGKPAILQSLSDTVRYTIHRACMWFNCSKQHNNAPNHKNTGVIQAIFHKCLYIRACPTWCTWLHLQWPPGPPEHCSHMEWGPKFVKMGTKWGPNFEWSGDQMGTFGSRNGDQMGTKWGLKKRIFDKLTEMC